jgi:hypothetical protein
MEIEHRNYLDLHRPNYEMVQNGYVRNIDLDILKMYEHIYRKYMNPDFILTVWCSHCIFDMIKRLYEWYDLQPNDDLVITFITDEVKKRKKRK